MGAAWCSGKEESCDGMVVAAALAEAVGCAGLEGVL
jgi:hypothetical protein